MRGKLWVGAIVLFGAAVTANATPIKWSDAETSIQKMSVADRGRPSVLESNAFDNKAFLFSVFDAHKDRSAVSERFDRDDVSFFSLLSDFFPSHSRLLASHTGETSTAAVTVPEPATLGLLGMGLFGAGFTRRRRR